MTLPSSLLIVDDNADFASTCEAILAEMGIRAVKASSGREAMGLCSSDGETVGLALVDLNMPELDGPATINALKLRMPRLKVIAISGTTPVPFFRRLNELGVRHFLPKPFLLDGFKESLEEALA